jgi:penicillin-binding protein 1A
VGKKVALALGVLFACVGIAAASFALWVLDVMASAPDIDTLEPAEAGANSEVFAADGTSLGFVQADVLRTPVTLDEIPKRLRNSTIAIEDEHFYEHDGVDFGAVARAAWENIEAGEIEQGGSTITQQLVRNLYIEDPERTFERKLIEAQMAMDYEEEYSKDEILEEYLNTASYGTTDGRTAVGVQAAAEVFFNKDVSDVNVNEAALLAGLPQAPTDYNPFLNPDGAKERRNQVLNAMAEQGYITESRYAALTAKGLGLERGRLYETREQQYFFDFVQQELIDEYGVQTVRDGGLKVYTTLDPKLQAAAQQSIIDNNNTVGAAAALVSTDTETGEILAMASSEAYEDRQFNLAAQGQRQPGSAFKPFALTAAVDQGIDPDSTYYSAPSTITLSQGQYSEPWTVSGGGGGTLSLREATANSVNTVFAQLVMDIGPESMDDMARRMGITAELNNYPAEVLGALTYGVSVLDMSNGFATLANGGVHHEPTAIQRVEFPNGEVDEAEDTEGTRVMTDGVAYTVVDVMTGTLDYGTASCCDIPCPAAGKTGTTEEQSDAWFIGYTPHVSTAVWVGNPDARVPMPGYGADLAAPIWQQYMLEAASSPCDDLPEPQNPASLSSFYGEHTATGDSDYYDYDDEETTTTTDDTGGTEVPSDENYDSDLYAPGAGQEPLPSPGDGGGDEGGAGGPGTTGDGGGAVPPGRTIP